MPLKKYGVMKGTAAGKILPQVIQTTKAPISDKLMGALVF